DVGTTSTDVTVTAGSTTLNGSAIEQVANVAPVVTINAPPPTVFEGSPLSMSATVTDPGIHDTFSYNWSANKNGVLFATGNTASFVFTPDDNGSYTVFLTVIDNSGGVGTAVPRSFTAINVAPTATLISNSPQPSNSPVTVTFTNLVDAAADIAAGLKFSFDWNNDGIFEITDQALPSASHNFTPDGHYKVHGRVKDKDGGFTDLFINVGEGFGRAAKLTTRYR